MRRANDLAATCASDSTISIGPRAAIATHCVRAHAVPATSSRIALRIAGTPSRTNTLHCSVNRAPREVGEQRRRNRSVLGR
jgi:hypothetical protein